MADATPTTPRRDIETKRTTSEVLLGGALSGMIAGVLMAVVAMIYSAGVGAGFLLPVQQIAAVWYGVEALIGDGGVVLAGLLTHLAVSAVFGIIFALVIRRNNSMGTSLAVGLLYGVAIWAVMTWIGLPLVNDVMAARVALIPTMWFVYHLVFGGSLLITPALERWAARLPEGRRPAVHA